jgi:hypothetical protein
MALDERDRLFRRLSEVIGEQEAGLLMASLPPTTPASKQDLDNLGSTVSRLSASIDSRFEAVDRRFDAVDERFVVLEERIDHKLESLEHRLLGALYRETSALRADMINQGRTFTVTMASSVLALASLVVVDRLL